MGDPIILGYMYSLKQIWGGLYNMTKKEEISKKAWELFLKRGYAKTPISDIAKTIGSSKGGLYRYFSNKEDLLFYIIESLMEKELVQSLIKRIGYQIPKKGLDIS